VTVDIATLVSELSLVLAFAIFLRDRINSESGQVDRLGAWTVVTFDMPASVDTPRVEEREVTPRLRNTSELPLRIRQIAYRIYATWAVEDPTQFRYPSGPGVRTSTNGTEPVRSFQVDIVVQPVKPRNCASL